MGIWEAMEKLSELVDDSDPDVSVSLTQAVAPLLELLPHPASFLFFSLCPRPLCVRMCRIIVPDVTRVFPLRPPFGSGF